MAPDRRDAFSCDEYARAAAPAREAVSSIGREAEGQQMNEPYSQWHQRNSPTDQPLAARYTGAEPILWNGSMVYPMYSDRLPQEPTLLFMSLLSQAPPAGLRGHGLGLAVQDAYIELDGHRLTGVDIWSDALARGVTVELVPTGAAPLFTLTPVWVDQTGAHRCWTGNYGMLVEDIPNDIVALWCSLGEGPPNFANLVVGVATVPAKRTGDAGRDPDADADAPAAEEIRAAEETGGGDEIGGGTEVRGGEEIGGGEEVGGGKEETRPGAHAVAADPPPAAPPPTHDDLSTADTDPSLPAVDENATMTMHYVRMASAAGAEPPATGPGHGYRNALYELGTAMYDRGEEAEACGLWAQAAEAGHAGAAYDLAVLLFRRGDHGGAERWWRRAAEYGEFRAMSLLAELLDRRGDHAEARQWRARAAEYAARAGQTLYS
ncbi:tetratricopeptide repeat protein [Nocardia farcinica]|uniref:tetratricopeptide repeat protein n=1 Tax=Nocardia farcinica TaxID=37329 RepID=UPI0024554293|nr:tetratricopeptide repeat protein [Nocardia farcinica]